MVRIVPKLKKKGKSKKQVNDDGDDSDGEIPEITIDFDDEEVNKTGGIKSAVESGEKKETDCVTDPAQKCKTRNEKNHGHSECLWKNVSEEITADDFMNISSDNITSEVDDVIEVVDLCDRRSKEFELAGDNLITVSVTQEIL